MRKKKWNSYWAEKRAELKMLLWWRSGWYERPTLIPGAIKYLGLFPCQGPCLNPWSNQVWVCVDICVLCYHGRPYSCLWSGVPPEATLISRRNTASWTTGIWVPCAFWWPGLFLGSWGSVLMSLIWVVTTSHLDASGLSSHLRQCWCLTATLLPVPYQSEWTVLPFKTMVISRAELQPRVMSGSVEDNEIKWYSDSSLYTIVFRKLLCSN